MSSLIIISNDKIFINKNIISSDYNDTINIVEGLQDKFDLKILSRKSTKTKNFFCKINNKTSFFRLKKDKKFYNKKIKILMISVTPYNVFKYFFLITQLKKIESYVLLRSDGYKEYYYKFGIFGKFFYHLLLSLVKFNSKILSVSSNLTNLKEKNVIDPSELDKNWFKNRKKAKLSIPKLLYLGRFRKEKGVFSIIKIFNEIHEKYKLTIAGEKIESKQSVKNIKFIGNLNNQKKIIKLYDDHNIFILPSYTEGSPKVVKESLSRLRPVIAFKEIKHIKRYKGVFICERNSLEFIKTIKYIINNYKNIQDRMKKNNLTLKKDFHKKLYKVLSA